MLSLIIDIRYERFISFILLYIFTSNLVETRQIESLQTNFSSIISIRYEGSSVDRIRIESMGNFSSMSNSIDSNQTNRFFNLIFLRNDDIFYQNQMEISSIQTKNKTIRTIFIRIFNCENFFENFTLNFHCDANSSSNECQFQCENIQNETKIQISFCENGSINSTKISLVEDLQFHWNLFDNVTDKDIELEITSQPMFWFIGVIVLFVLLIFGFINWKGKEFKEFLNNKRRNKFDLESSIGSSNSSFYHYQIKEMKPKLLSFYVNFRIENRRILRREFQDLENLSPICSERKTRSKYLKFDRDEKIFARGPWSKTAVHLKNENRTEDYINANEIKGIHHEKEFIACQQPMENTCEDFWQMILQYRTTTIVMLNNFDEENSICQSYFPLNVEQTIELKNIRVTTIHIERRMKSQLEIRQIIVEQGSNEHRLTHYFYLNWIENRSISATTLIDLIEIIRPNKENIHSPIVVHCRLGTGRTGTFIAMNILIDLIDETTTINLSTFKLDLMGIVHQLRLDRTKLVEREDEYSLLHRGVNEYLQRKSRSEIFSRESDLNRIFSNDRRITPDIPTIEESKIHQDIEVVRVRL